MLLNLFISGLVLAGLGRIWAKLQKDLPFIKEFIKNKLHHLLAHALTCSFCFTFWLSLIFVLFFDPLVGWMPVNRIEINIIWEQFLKILFSWMAVGTTSWIIRFIMDELQMLVHYQNHILKEKSGHK